MIFRRAAAPRDEFAARVLPHLDAAVTLARWLVRDPQVAEDVVQDAMLRALRFYAGFRGENPRAWLLQIVRTVAWQALRDRGALREDTLPEPDTPTLADDAPSPEAVVAGMQDLVAVAGVIEAMPPELRECLVLREIEEMSYKDIARITAAPIGTVMSRLWRARQVLMRAREPAQ